MRGNMLETKSIVSQFPKVVPEYLLVQIPEQMERLNADVGAFELALEQAPEILQSICVNLSVNVLFGMVNHLVLESFFPESLIGHKGVGIDCASRFDLSADISLERLLFAIPDYSGANLTTTFQNSHHGGFFLCATLLNPAPAVVNVHESGCTPNARFVKFDFALPPTHF